MNDLYDNQRGALATLAGGIAHRDGQLGALAAFAGRAQVLDMVSRPQVFASLLPATGSGLRLGCALERGASG